MKSVLVLLSVAGVLSLEAPRCDPGFVAIPANFESFTCVSRGRLERMKQTKFVTDAGTRFLLWTQQTKAGEREELRLDDLNALKNTTFNARNPTRILIHGWLSDWTVESVDGLAKAYIAKGAYNVIGVDWSAAASTIFYPLARMQVGAVAETVAKQISLFLRAGQKPAQIVIIGHSLGAHVAGMTGKHFPNIPKLAAVVGLDPAGPLFSENRPSERLDLLDAEYVEVIHTNLGWLGYHAVLGQADFFPNGGYSQAGCVTHTCDHQRSVEYFRMSLESTQPLYVGRRCETKLINDACDGALAVMGSDPDERFKLKTSGVFYLQISN
ncbi:lipase member H-like [Anopheles ziemanni]|uniref:lipase member H-like n=1 Tax=Anopheles coustani TaxID=139045 RepID=UPI00265821B8|nr:lipase member H-like [Anopheles coustani]XP_058170444.1 lipase member H-like [Anopheles ziemanni]